MKAHGNLLGLRPGVLRDLERLFERRAGTESFIDPHFAVALQDAAIRCGRRVGVLADRRGVVRDVIVGDWTTLDIPAWARQRTGPDRLGGLRLLHVVFGGHGLDRNALETMRLYSLDATVAVIAGDEGAMPLVEAAHLLPVNPDGRLWEVLPVVHATALTIRFDDTIRDIESQMRRYATALRSRGGGGAPDAKDAAILVLPVMDSATDPARETAELQALCKTAGVAVAEVVIQQRARPDPRTLIGRGKLREVTMLGLQKGVDLIVFGAALTPSQQRSVAEATGVRVVDRNQLILDIFARHARTNEGRLEVELAQLRYNLPRLSEKDDAMSRLTGGIGAQGPGETTLEMERRRARKRIHELEKRLQTHSARRSQRRRRRLEGDLPMVAIVGYTNAGKSTLFNRLSGADVLADNMLFATLDPTVRRAWLAEGCEILLCDTVGFIRDLPAELEGAFRATLEEVATARILLHVADASDPHIEDQVSSVRRILHASGLGDRPSILVLNKADRVGDKQALSDLASFLGGHQASALDASSLEHIRRILVGKFSADRMT